LEFNRDAVREDDSSDLLLGANALAAGASID